MVRRKILYLRPVFGGEVVDISSGGVFNVCTVPGEELFVCCALEEFVTGRPLLEEQSLTHILKSQCPPVFTRFSHYMEDFRELGTRDWSFLKNKNMIPEREKI